MKKLWIAVAGAVALLAVLVVAGVVLVGPRLKEAGQDLGQQVVRATPAARAPSAGASMRIPRAKKCLQAPTIDMEGEDGFAMRVGTGLEPQQISGAFGPFNSFLASCQPVDGEDHSGTVVYGFTVGCDGLVKELDVVDDSLYEPEMLECLSERLRYVDFPAHDLEDGMYFEFPLMFHPPS